MSVLRLTVKWLFFNQPGECIVRMTRLFLSLVTSAYCVFISAGNVHAGFVYDYAFDRPSYVVGSGGTVEVKVFLQETVSAGDASRLLTDGLIGAGVRVQFDIPTVPADPARVLGVADILPNTTAFDDSFGPVTSLISGSSASLSETVDLFSPAVQATLVAPNTYQIYLGSFLFMAGSSPGQVTTIRALDIPSTSDTVTGAGLALDSLVNSADATVVVTVAVPEPVSALLLGTGSIALLGWIRRRGARA